MNSESVLSKLGLSAGEVKVYLALVELGESTVGPIVKLARISNSKIYEVLNKLSQKGLVKYVTKHKTKYFSVSGVVALNDYLKRQEDSLAEVRSGLGGLIDELNSKGADSGEDVAIFKGIKGIKAGLVEAIQSLRSGEDYYFFSKGYGEDEAMSRLFNEISLMLRSRKARIRGLANVNEKQLFQKVYKKLGYDMRYVDFSWPSDLTICGAYVAIIVLEGDPSLYLIKSRSLADSYLQFFKNFWN